MGAQFQVVVIASVHSHGETIAHCVTWKRQGCVLGDPPRELWPNMDKETKRLRKALKKIENRTNDPVALSIAGETLVD